MSAIKRMFEKIRKEFYKAYGLRNKNDEQVKWGILGLGYMANVFTEALEASRQARVVAAASRDKSKAMTFAKKHHVERAYGSYLEMLEGNKGKIDIIYIATPLECHYEHVKMCLEHGYGVLCEKPITSDHNQLKELIDLARNKKLFLMEGMWLRCLPTYRKAYAWIQEGRIGDLVSIEVDLSKSKIASVNKIMTKPYNVESVLLDYGIYALTFPLDFMKENVQIKYYEREGKEGVDVEWRICLTDENVQARITISSIHDGNRQAIIKGTRGKIVFESQFNRTNIIHILNDAGEIVETFRERYIFEGFEYEVEEVNYSILNGCLESERVPLEKSNNTLELVDLLLK